MSGTAHSGNLQRDPIGVRDNEKLADEYDSYAPSLYQLARQQDTEAILQFLRRVEQDLGLATDPVRNERVASQIIEAVGPSKEP
jgi:hypothetical protein